MGASDAGSATVIRIRRTSGCSTASMASRSGMTTADPGSAPNTGRPAGADRMPPKRFRVQLISWRRQVERARRCGAQNAKIRQFGIRAQGVDDDDAGIEIGLGRHPKNQPPQTDQRRGQVSPQHGAQTTQCGAISIRKGVANGRTSSDQTVGQEDLPALYRDQQATQVRRRLLP
jgi:hypothetical protein